MSTEPSVFTAAKTFVVEATCTTLIVFDGEGDVRLFNGRYSDWAEQDQRRSEEIQEAESAAKQKVALKEKAKKAKVRKKEEAARAVTKQQTAFSKLSLKELEKQIERTESRIREIDELMMDPDVYTDGPRTRKLQSERASLAEELEPLEFEWSCRAEDA